MKIFCKRLCCMIFCCRCSKPNPLKSIDENTRLLPKNIKTKNILEKNEIHMYGSVPESLKNAVIEVSQYSKSTVRKIVCGSNHCLILFNDGNFGVFGSNADGQLGLPITKENNYVNQIKLNKFNIPIPNQKGSSNDFEIWDIAAGDNFSLVLVKSINKSYLLRFGIKKEEKYLDNVQNINTINIEQIDYEKTGMINNVYSFGQRILLLTHENKVYVGGVDFNQNPLEKFKFCESFSNPIKGIYMGLEHCLVLDDQGILYAVGDNTYGELGIENSTIIEKFHRIPFEFKDPIKKVSVGARHTLVLLENGKLYAFGDNSESQCSGSLSRYSQPNLVDFESKQKIIDIYSGYNHNLLILSNGDLMTWGYTSNGKLGYVENNLSQNVPRAIQLLKGKFANYICLGNNLTIISTSSSDNSLVILSKNM